MQVERRNYHCPNEQCENFNRSAKHTRARFYVREGKFITQWNHQPVPRYHCKACGKYFSSHTFRSTFLQKRPDLNSQVYRLYCSGTTQRRIAKELGCNLKTVVRKFLFMAREARKAHERMLASNADSVDEVQFDEMESFEHTRLKPVSIALAVSGDGKQIIDAQVGTLHYKGRLAALALRKYGKRQDTSKQARGSTLQSVAQVSKPQLKIVTDAKPSYSQELKENFQDCAHVAVANRRNQIQYAQNPTRRKNIDDPLFWLNHVAARIRHDVSRMMRKVWTTTKRIDRLEAHLNLFIAYYNGYSF